MNKNAAELFQGLIDIVHRLRDPKTGCPWDREQTHSSLKPYLIEESYEVIDAIDHTPDKIGDELGDVLLQIMLHSEIAQEENRFTIADVISKVSTKMIDRHPHVFGTTRVETSSQVVNNWEKIKAKELPKGKSILDGVPRSMPALLRAHRTGEKVARVGFEWPTLDGVIDKVHEEFKEFADAAHNQAASRQELEEEFGDILFSLAQLSRRLGFNAEELLQRANDKFSGRFKKVESEVGDRLESAGLEELDKIWNVVKSKERSKA